MSQRRIADFVGKLLGRPEPDTECEQSRQADEAVGDDHQQPHGNDAAKSRDEKSKQAASEEERSERRLMPDLGIEDCFLDDQRDRKQDEVHSVADV